MDIIPIPPAPERCTMRVDREGLVLDFGNGQSRIIGQAHNTDIARRLAACWNKFEGMPTSMIESMPESGVKGLAAIALGAEDDIESIGVALARAAIGGRR